ncbi:MAG: alpha/beta hydrolase [Mucinivorans sp.]
MKKIIFILSIFAFGIDLASAQQELPLWSAAHPAPHKSVLTGPETAPDDGGRIENITQPTITVYLPEKSKSTGQAVIMCPGGAYYLLTTYNEGSFFAPLLNENGIACIVLKHRMPGGVHYLPLEDADRAMEIVRQNATKWAIDTSKIGVCGFSAGGNVAAIFSTMGAIRPAFTVLFYPVVSMRQGITHEGSRENLMGNLPLRDYYSAELRVDAKTPPALMFHCLDDTAVSIANSYLYNDALRAHHIPSQVVAYPTGGHGWGFSDKMPSHENMKVTLVDWLKKLNK